MVKKEKWSSRELERQINSSYFERVMIGNEKLSPAVRGLSKDIYNSFKDSYVLELLHLPEKHLEKDLRQAIAQNITKFLLEFGRDYAFMGEEYPVQVGDQDFAIDLVFYNRSLNCMVAIELKIEKFKPEHLGQLSFYMTAIDKQVKTEQDSTTIGLLLCKNKDNVVAEYALGDKTKPMGIAEYKLAQALPEVLETSLPSIEQIERELRGADHA